MIDNIYIKKIHTRFNPKYIAEGNYGSLIIVEEAFQGNYDTLSYFKLPFNQFVIVGQVKRVSKQRFLSSVCFSSPDSVITAESEHDNLEGATEGLESLLIDKLDECRELVKQAYPDFYEQEGQLTLFD